MYQALSCLRMLILDDNKLDYIVMQLDFDWLVLSKAQ